MRKENLFQNSSPTRSLPKFFRKIDATKLEFFGVEIQQWYIRKIFGEQQHIAMIVARNSCSRARKTFRHLIHSERHGRGDVLASVLTFAILVLFV